MAKNIARMKPTEKELSQKTLLAAAKGMGGDGAVVQFITTLLTESEQVMIGRRLLIAQMLLAGTKQSEIIYELGVSPNTFSRTRKWLQGQIPEYDKALKEFQKEQTKKERRIVNRPNNYVDPVTFAALKKKYPAHFLLFNIADELLKNKK